uniref:NB-ARC domain-containing protein n=1 Tax=Physcomitrium patens TaxID=3218 RepID=A0A2K1IVD1_PHYPA|nr:hypothetical protein PHYPA_025180 [Physcomitrium patens]
MDRKIVEEEKEYKDTRIWNTNIVPMHGITTKLESIILDYNMKDILRRFIIKELHFCSLRILIYNIDAKQSKDVFEIFILLVENGTKLKILLLRGYHYRISYGFHMSKIKLLAVMCSEEFWKVFEELTILSLIGFTLSEPLPRILFTICTLMRLDLDGSIKLNVVQKGFKNLTNLTNMRLLNNKTLNIMSKEWTNLTSLKILDMSRCSSLTSLPNKMTNLFSLEELYLTSCSSLTNLRNELANLSYLRRFDLRYCSSLKSLPNELTNLSSLKELNLKLANLSSLTVFNLGSWSSLKSLPNELANLSFLTRFNLSSCSSLTSLSNELENLSTLKVLYLEH